MDFSHRLLSAVLALSLGWSMPVQADSATSQVDSEPQLEQLSLGPLLREVLQFDEAAGTWQVLRPVDAKTPVVVLHFWADWCKPCVDEFPIVREIAEQMQAAHREKLHVLYLTQTQGQAELQSFLFKHRARLPSAPVYQSKALSDWLLSHLARSGLPMPLTLVLDERRVVRLAIMGSVAQRRSQLVQTVSRLVSNRFGDMP